MNRIITTDIEKAKNNHYAIIIIGVLFFIFGFITWLNGTLIPFLKITCELKSDTQAFFVVTASYMAYFFLALPSSLILKRTGYKNGMALGLLVMVIGTAIFIPAATNRSFSLFLTGLFLQGAGLALLQTASNPYISVLGPIESAAKRISIMGICNKVAGAVSPLILSTLLLANIGKTQTDLASTSDPVQREILLSELAERIKTPYIIMALILIVLAIMIYRSSLPEIKDNNDTKDVKPQSAKSIFGFLHLWLGVLSIFLYVGVEVLAGDAIGIYGNSMGIPLTETKYFTSFTLTAMLAGYIIGIITIPKYISQQTALKLSAILGIILTLGIYFSHGYIAIALVALLGLANALMWPAIFPLAISGLGSKTKIGSAFLIMGIAGGAIIPLIFTSLKHMPAVGYKLAFFICLFPAYLYILYYSVAGYKAGKKYNKIKKYNIMYQDISVKKRDGITNSLKKEGDEIYMQLKLQAKQYFDKHIPPALITDWNVQKTLLYSTIVKKAGITFHGDLPFLTKETGSVKMEGYTIKNLFFQTLPGVFITANLYIPDGNGPFPAIVNLHGHIKDGRLDKSIQARSHILASNGFISLCADAFGSGERSVVHGESDYHGGNIGAALFNLGKSLLGIQVSENIRCVDFLCSLDYVDKNAIGTTGESGGGNQAMWLGAMDERVKAVMPVVSVGTFEAFIMAHNCVCELLPDGLTFCEEFQILGLIAPRALNVCNALQETHPAFSATEMVRTVKNTGEIYKLFKADELFHVQIFNNTHEYSKKMQQAMLFWFTQHLKKADMQQVKTPSVIYLENDQLRVFAMGKRSSHIISLPGFLESEGKRILQQALCNKSNAEDERERLKSILHIKEWESSRNKNSRAKNSITKINAGDENVVTLICNPKGQKDGSGIANTGMEVSGQIITVDLWGTGSQSSAVADYYDALMVPFHTLSRTCFWLGRTVIGEWVFQLYEVIIDILTVKPNATIKVVAYGEAGVAALLYAALYDNISGIELINAPYSYLVADSTNTDYYNMAMVLPGIITWGDLVNATALCNCTISFVNARNVNRVLATETEKDALLKIHHKQKHIYQSKSTLQFITH